MIIKPEDMVFRPLLPDKYVNYKECRDSIDFHYESLELVKVLDTAPNENYVQRYIKDNKKWFVPYSVLDGYPFYNAAGAYLFVEQKLGAEYQADYCLIAENSDGYHLLMIEFEAPNVKYLLENSNSESEAVRKGLIQIRDWELWLENNRDYLFDSMGLKGKGIDIPLSRIHYCLVVSRRALMDDRARNMRSKTISAARNLRIITYDRLVDNIARS
jgi:hypothetical protein